MRYYFYLGKPFFVVGIVRFKLEEILLVMVMMRMRRVLLTMMLDLGVEGGEDGVCGGEGQF